MSKKLNKIARENDIEAKKLVLLAQDLGMNVSHWLHEVDEEQEKILIKNLQSQRDEAQKEFTADMRNAFSINLKPNGRWGVLILSFHKAEPSKLLDSTYYQEDYRFKGDAFLQMLSMIQTDRNFMMEE